MEISLAIACPTEQFLVPKGTYKTATDYFADKKIHHRQRGGPSTQRHARLRRPNKFDICTQTSRTTHSVWRNANVIWCDLQPSRDVQVVNDRALLPVTINVPSHSRRLRLASATPFAYKNSNEPTQTRRALELMGNGPRKI